MTALAIEPIVEPLALTELMRVVLVPATLYDEDVGQTAVDAIWHRGHIIENVCHRRIGNDSPGTGDVDPVSRLTNRGGPGTDRDPYQKLNWRSHYAVRWDGVGFAITNHLDGINLTGQQER
jgi:hypothetical protein